MVMELQIGMMIASTTMEIVGETLMVAQIMMEMGGVIPMMHLIGMTLSGKIMMEIIMETTPMGIVRMLAPMNQETVGGTALGVMTPIMTGPVTQQVNGIFGKALMHSCMTPANGVTGTGIHMAIIWI
jgi:hypothetical protein